MPIERWLVYIRDTDEKFLLGIRITGKGEETSLVFVKADEYSDQQILVRSSASMKKGPIEVNSL